MIIIIDNMIGLIIFLINLFSTEQDLQIVSMPIQKEVKPTLEVQKEL